MPLFRLADDQSVERVCGGCRLFATKPGTEPPELLEAIITASRLDAIHEVGGTFAYPDSLSPFEWTCLVALGAGRAEADAKEMRKTQGGNDDRSRLQSLVQRINQK